MRIFFSCLFFGRRFGEVEHSRIVLIGHFVLDGVIKHLIEDLFQGQLNVIGRVVRYSASVDKGAVQQGVLDMRDSNSAHRHIVQVVCILPCAIGRGDISTAYFFGVFVDPALVKLLHGEYLRQVIGTLVVFHEGFIGIVIHHQELGLPWNQPVPEEKWEQVAEYCDNDVIATEAVFNSKDRKADFVAREILADVAGMTVNDTTNSLTTRIIFGKEKHPQLVYTDLATGKSDSVVEVEPDILTDKNIINAFPGYEWVRGEDGRMHNMFRGTDLGLGGYVYAEPGMYYNIALLDVASLHPHSAVALNYFGDYTKNFNDLMDVRIYVKHGEYDKAKKLFGGKLSKYLDDPAQAKALAQALKIAINSVYGLTSATFDNPFRNPKNANNIVALRGALFMRTLQDEVQQRGFTVAHIKTDSIKIPDATPEIIDFCMDFAKKYGYTFEHEATYEKMCLVNNAVYIAKYLDADTAKAQYGYIPEKNEKKGGHWTATGAQFQVPYVFKTLFSHEDIVFNDLCETKSVSKGAIYLDKNEALPEDEHNYIFVGRVGQFCPIKPGCGGALLMREAGVRDDGETKYNSVTGAKDYRWLESEMVYNLHLEDSIDRSYFDKMVDDAADTITKYGDLEWFVSDDDGMPPWQNPDLPWGDIQDEAARNYEVR